MKDTALVSISLAKLLPPRVALGALVPPRRRNSLFHCARGGSFSLRRRLIGILYAKNENLSGLRGGCSPFDRPPQITYTTETRLALYVIRYSSSNAPLTSSQGIPSNASKII